MRVKSCLLRKGSGCSRGPQPTNLEVTAANRRFANLSSMSGWRDSNSSAMSTVLVWEREASAQGPTRAFTHKGWLSASFSLDRDLDH